MDSQVHCPKGGNDMEKQSEGVLARVTQQLSRLEKRDSELWVIVSLTGILFAAAVLVVLLPAAFLKDETIHLEITVSRQLAIGLLVMLALANTYLITRRIEVRRLREKLISTTLQKELIEQQSFTDPLTEIYNRRSFEEISGRFVSLARRQKKSLTFMMIDADNFKEVNSRFGHLTGDFVLAEIAGLLKRSIRGSDAVVRYGGDEFVVILAETTLAGSTRVVERINQQLVEWNAAGNLKGYRMGLSTGAAEWSEGMTIDAVLEAADRAMYKVKDTRPTVAAPEREEIAADGAN